MVIIAGLEEGLFPHSRASGEPAEIEEERRLCYVGMTRARSRLVLTGAANRRIYGEYKSSQPSRFLDEVPAELVDRLVPATTPSPYQGHFPHYEFRTDPYGRRGRRAREEPAAYTYEDEDQSANLFQLRTGMRVRRFGSVIDPSAILVRNVAAVMVTADEKLVNALAGSAWAAHAMKLQDVP